jgi:hypothetical protein
LPEKKGRALERALIKTLWAPSLAGGGPESFSYKIAIEFLYLAIELLIKKTFIAKAINVLKKPLSWTA